MDYKKLSRDIVENVGGQSNIQLLSHCMTRLRFNLKDVTKANKENLEKLEGVVGVVYAGGQYMVILGQHLLPTYDILTNDYHLNSGSTINENLDGNLNMKESLTWKNLPSKMIGFISSSVTPMIPGLIAGGMLKVALLLYVTFINKNAITSSTYLLLAAIADAPFYFMPVFVAYGAAVKLGGTPIYAMVASAALLHGNFTTLVTAAKPIELFGINVRLLSYGGSMLPALLVAIVAYYVEKYLNKIIPSIFKAIFVGMGTIFIAGVLAFLVLGPLGNTVGQAIAALFMFLDSTVGPLAVGLLAAVLPWMVMAGMHTALSPFMPQLLLNPGYDAMLRPAFFMHNMAEGGAVLGVIGRTKDKVKRSEYISIVIGCIVAGVTEPAIYGVNLKYKKPMYGVMAGGFAGGMVASLLGVRAFVMGYSNILALPIFGKTVVGAVIAVITTIIVSALVTFILGIDIPENSEATHITAPVQATVSDETLVSVVDGVICPLETVKDPVFSKKLMGDGLSFEVKGDFIGSPINGVISSVFPTGHAFGVIGNNGIEFLIHIGLNTVELQGKGFDVLAKAGDKVRAGQPVVKIDRELITAKGYDLRTMLIVTSQDFPISHTKIDDQEVKLGEKLFEQKVEENQ